MVSCPLAVGRSAVRTVSANPGMRVSTVYLPGRSSNRASPRSSAIAFSTVLPQRTSTAAFGSAASLTSATRITAGTGVVLEIHTHGCKSAELRSEAVDCENMHWRGCQEQHAGPNPERNKERCAAKLHVNPVLFVRATGRSRQHSAARRQNRDHVGKWSFPAAGGPRREGSLQSLGARSQNTTNSVRDQADLLDPGIRRG